MRCSEARRRLIESGALSECMDDDLKEHLGRCSDCAAYARADLALRSDLRAAAADEIADDMPLSSLRSNIETIVAGRSKLERIMSNIKYEVSSRPRLITGIGLALAVLIIFTLIPFSFTRVIGYKVSIAGLEPESNLSPSLLSDVIAAIGYEDITVTTQVEGDKKKYTIENIPSENEAHILASVVASVGGYEMASVQESDGDVVSQVAIRKKADKGGLKSVVLSPRYVNINVEPVVESEKGPLYVRIATSASTKSSAISTARIRPIGLQFDDKGIIINGEDLDGALLSPEKSDSDIEAMVRAFFLRHGVADSNITVVSLTDLDNDSRIVKINLDESFGLKMDGGILQVDVDNKSLYPKQMDLKKRFASNKLYELVVPDSTFKGETILLNLRLSDTD